MLEILFLLLPLAFYSGWRTAHKKNRSSQTGATEVSTRFVQGINFLLNEEPDKALDVFLEAPSLDAQAAETFLALGKMFRNRGEVNRALRLHQHLVARPDLTNTQRQLAMLALGEDFFSAGLLDRAEGVFNELIKSYPKNTTACIPLRRIYEQLHEWEKAFTLTECSVTDKTERTHLMTHYLCEQVEELLAKNQLFQADEKLKKALSIYPQSARVQTLLAELALARGERAVALKYFRQALVYDQHLLSSLVKRLLSVFTQPTELQQLYEVVSTEYRRNPDAKMLPALAAIEQEIGQGGSLVPVLHQHLQHELGNLQTLTCAARYLSKESDTKTTLNELSLALGRLANTLPRFQCANCGYKLHEYVWRCPACHHWDSVQSQ
ncbi:hypothetical protein [uncultured Thiothrix sp.]|uniref:tetratricopeptide repeat protein n=1 Tax=uncultured Thiothrix sp. TaxID=223185 RepID=UPI002615F2A0|nr:hypothetical protein [uncultured Thiothrix sp.]